MLHSRNRFVSLKSFENIVSQLITPENSFQASGMGGKANFWVHSKAGYLFDFKSIPFR